MAVSQKDWKNQIQELDWLKWILTAVRFSHLDRPLDRSCTE